MASVRIKVVIVGDLATGKTSLLERFETGQFHDFYQPTIFRNLLSKIVIDGQMVIKWKLKCLNNLTWFDSQIELALWDISGAEEYDRLLELSYPKADVVLLCFALDSRDSFKKISEKFKPEAGFH